MNIVLYQAVAKKLNSTKQPVGNGTTFSGYLREPCSIYTPVFKIERLNSDVPPTWYTYAYIGKFSRYYFVEDWVWAEGLWEAHLKVDVLASFRTEIGNATEYILRHDSTSDYNEYITDTTYPATTDIETHSYELNNVFTTNLHEGCFVVGIISSGNTNSPVGAISYYAMTATEFGAFKNLLFTNSNLETMGIIDQSQQDLIANLPKELIKTIYNPFQYVVSCMWFPFGKSAIPSTSGVSQIPLGWWTYTASASAMYAQTFELGNETFTITDHPQALTRGKYLNKAPYTVAYLVGRFGTIALDTSKFGENTTGKITYLIDYITGQCIAKVSVTASGNLEKLIVERPFLLGVPIQLAQVTTDFLGVTMSVNNAIGDTFSGIMNGAKSGGVAGAIVSGIQNTINGIGNTLKSAMPILETSGTNGAFLSAVNVSHLVLMHYKIVDEDIAHRGRPLCELRQINTLSGFIMCAEGDLDISCYDNERKEISKFLTEGFFWE